MELRHLRYFIVVAEQLHFGRAAKLLNISQPPLSNQIKNLEEEMQVQLLVRNNKEVRLTPAGRHFLKAAKKCIADLDKEIALTQRIAQGKEGTLSIGFSGTLSFHLIPTLVKEFKRHHPGVDIHLQQLTTQDQLVGLIHESLDVGFLVSPVADPRIALLDIFEERFVACLPKHHRLARQTSLIDAAELRDEHWVLTPRSAGHGYYDAVIALCDASGFTPHVVQTAQEQQTLVALVAADMGVTVLPYSAQAIKNDHVVYKEIDADIRKVSAMAWNPDHLTDTARHFIRYIETGLNEGTIEQPTEPYRSHLGG
ncbi:LysR family transcriptional regulator [Vreelandella malpeensis]|uniref:LysR family transcriptional regulator n=1 Tax=Vreelandella malpeensis TaxID=1172368 RepID=A0ABS8DNM0_9GAMM|nr:LysR family transcriptional regulator [Halomonas malpeensis]MCB8887897.1 LysR family transcriptional regulator [Halomonas malpeensis]